MEIKNIYGAVIFTSAALTIKDAVLEAIAKKSDLRGANLSSADLRSAYLSGADLRGANLRSAYLSSAYLSSANLSGADLSSAYLRGANLSGADLSSADLSSAYLSSANLRGADLRGAYLSSANLSSADLSGADLSSADLSSAYLRGAKNSEKALAAIQFIPETGPFEAWKICLEGVLVHLLIPADAKRSHGEGRKCRASHVVVLEVIGADEGRSSHGNATYRTGETVTADSWDEDRWNVCSHGIHFFLTKIEAENYEL